MSASSIRRFLGDVKAQDRRKSNTGTRRGVRKLLTQIPIRNLGERPTAPGTVELDTVAHCGDNMSGVFAWTLTATDVYTGWTENWAMWGKSGKEVSQALDEIIPRFPFQVKCLSIDNGSEFINQDVMDWLGKEERNQKLSLVRGRPYKKNDQCFVEQKNNTHVREVMGYGRLDWHKVVPMMNNIYRGISSELQNAYCPQFKLKEKKRVFSKVIRKHEDPKTPLERMRKCGTESEVSRAEAVITGRSPFDLERQLKKAVRNIYGSFKGRKDEKNWGKRAT